MCNFLNSMSFLVRVPVLSESKKWILPKFLTDGRCPDDDIWNLWIICNVIGIHRLSHIQVDSQPQWDDRREEDDETNKVNDPQAIEALHGYECQGKCNDNCTKHLGQRIEFLLRQSDLGVRHAGVHDCSRIGSSVDDDSEGGMTGHDSVHPHGMLNPQWLLLVATPQRPYEGVDILLRGICLDIKIQIQDGFIGGQFLSHASASLNFQSVSPSS